MNWYEKIKRYYNEGRYTIEQMKVFVKGKKITPEEFEKITGIPYED